MKKYLLLLILLLIPSYGYSAIELYNGSSGRVYCSYIADSSPFDSIGSGSTIVRMEIRGVGGSDDGKYWTGSAWTVTATTLTNSNLTFYRGGLWYVAVTPSTGMTHLTTSCFTSDSSGIPYDYVMDVYPANRFNDAIDPVLISDGIGAGQLALTEGGVDTCTSVTNGVTLADDAITAAKIAAGAITSSEAPNLDAAVSTRAPESGGNIAAIKTKTDQLTFTVANQVDANALTGGGGIPVTIGMGSSTTVVNLSSNSIDVDNKYVTRPPYILNCPGFGTSEIVATDDNTTDTITVAIGHPFSSAPTNTTVCTIER